MSAFRRAARTRTDGTCRRVVRRKTGTLSLSLEGHFGRIEDRDELSVAAGLQYDLARGLSANFGLNHAEARLTLDGARFVDTRETRGALSLRYSF